MSITVLAKVYAGVLCHDEDFFTQGDVVWRCQRGHVRERENDRFCFQCGAAYEPRKKTIPTPALAAVMGERSYAEDAASFLRELLAEACDLHSAARLQPRGGSGRATYILGWEIANVGVWREPSDEPLPFALTPEIRRDVEALTEKYGIDPNRPVQLFLALYYSG